MNRYMKKKNSENNIEKWKGKQHKHMIDQSTGNMLLEKITQVYTWAYFCGKSSTWYINLWGKA